MKCFFRKSKNLKIIDVSDFKENISEIMNHNDKIIIKRPEANLIIFPLNDYNSLQEASNKWYIMSHQRDKICFDVFLDSSVVE